MVDLPTSSSPLVAWKSYLRHRLAQARGSKEPLDIPPAVVEELATLLEDECREAIESGVDPGDRKTLEQRIERRVGSFDELADELAESLAARRQPVFQSVPPDPPGLAAARSPQMPGPSSGSVSPVAMFLSLAADLRTAVRSLIRAPRISLLAIAVLALGIGSVTGIFSLLDAVLFEPLPYQDPDRLAVVRVDAFGRQGVPLITDSDAIDFSQGAATVEELELFASIKVMLDSSVGEKLVTATLATPGLFRVLGVDVVQGRNFREAGDATEGASGNVLLSHELWQEHFAGDPEVVGSAVRISEQEVQVVGILPPGHRFLVRPGVREHSDLAMAIIRPQERGILYRRQALVRLSPDATAEQASVELNALAQRGRETDRALNPEGSVHYEVVRLEESLREDVADALLGLFLAGVMILVLVSVNVSHLLLLRGMSQRADWALRRALGASRWRLLGQGLTESLVLALLGGVLGLALAWVLCRTIPLLPALEVPRLDSVVIDLEVMLFLVSATLLAAVLAGLIPALNASRSTASMLHAPRGLGAGRRSRLANLMVVGQIALAIVLLACSGALLRSLQNLHDVPLGFEPDGVLAFDFSVNRELREDDEKRLRFNRDLLGWLEEQPGVESASLVNVLPFAGRRNLAAYSYDAASEATFGELTASFHRVLPGYFETLSIDLLSGRDFTDSDTDRAAYVAVVSEKLARSSWPGESAIGKSLTIEFAAANGTERRPAEIVGVVAEVRETDLRSDELPQVYLPYWPGSYAQDFVVRSSTPPLELALQIDQELRRRGEGLVVDDREPLATVVSEATADLRLALMLLAAFALAALLVACLGLYGTLSYSVSRRTSEFGLRQALGATASTLLLSVASRGLLLAGMGCLVGIAFSVLALRSASAFLFGVSPTDASLLVAVSLLLLLAAVLACLFPARRATRVSPTEALRCE